MEPKGESKESCVRIPVTLVNSWTFAGKLESSGALSNLLLSCVVDAVKVLSYTKRTQWHKCTICNYLTWDNSPCSRNQSGWAGSCSGHQHFFVASHQACSGPSECHWSLAVWSVHCFPLQSNPRWPLIILESTSEVLSKHLRVHKSTPVRSVHWDHSTDAPELHMKHTIIYQ